MSQSEFTETEYEILYKLTSLCKEYHVFQFDDLVIKGMKVDVIKRFLKERPSMKFRTWLIAKGLVEKEL